MADKVVLLRRRRRHRRSRSPKPTSNSSATASSRSTAINSASTPRTSPRRPTQTARSCRSRSTKDPTAREFQWLVIRHHHRRPPRLPRLPQASGAATDYDAAIQRSQNASPSPTAPSIARSKPCSSKFWVATRQYDQDDKSEFAAPIVRRRNPQSQGRKDLQRNAHRRQLRRHRRQVRSARRRHARPVPAAQSSTAAAARSASKNTRSPNSKSRSTRRPSPSCSAKRSPPRSTPSTTSARPSPMPRSSTKSSAPSTRPRWYPPGPWDWLYGPGYWWFAYDYDWYPGWRDWGCRPPVHVVVDLEPTVAAGNRRRARSAHRPRWHGLQVEIDTSLAKALHPDQDHRYTDRSRSRRPIAPHDRRHRRGARRPPAVPESSPGSIAATTASATRSTPASPPAARRQTASKAPASCSCSRSPTTRPPRRKPIETEVRNWEPRHRRRRPRRHPTSKPPKRASIASSYSVTDKAGHDHRRRLPLHDHRRRLRRQRLPLQRSRNRPRQARIRPRRKSPAAAQHQSRRLHRPALPASVERRLPRRRKLLHLTGKSTVVEVDVTPKDMPNFFVEAVTVSDGRVYTEVREIHVPPAKRILNVEVAPLGRSLSSRANMPKIKVKLTDEAGKPFVGSTVLSIFDKSVEYISGGSNVGDIKDFFWKWRRQHRPYLEDNLDRWCANLVAARTSRHGKPRRVRRLGRRRRYELATDTQRRRPDAMDRRGGSRLGGGGGEADVGGARWHGLRRSRADGNAARSDGETSADTTTP